MFRRTAAALLLSLAALVAAPAVAQQPKADAPKGEAPKADAPKETPVPDVSPAAYVIGFGGIILVLAVVCYPSRGTR